MFDKKNIITLNFSISLMVILFSTAYSQVSFQTIPTNQSQ